MRAAVTAVVALVAVSACSTAGDATRPTQSSTSRSIPVSTTSAVRSSARSPEEAIAPIVETNGVRWAHLSYTFSFNGLTTPPGEPWRSNLIDPQQIVADATDARVRGAEAVIVSLHWGLERVVEPTAEQRRVADAITASGVVDLIVGQHAHVLQPIEQVNGVWVAWGLGNVLSDHPTSSTWPMQSSDGVLLNVTISVVDGIATVAPPTATATWCDAGNGNVIYPVSLADDLSIDAALRLQLVASRQRTGEVIGEYLIDP